MAELHGLLAYPSRPDTIGGTLRSTLEILRLEGIGQNLTTWEENDIPGRFVVDPILSQIDDGNILIADITRLNFNVTFEIGYAIGREKRVGLIKNSSLTGSDELIRQVGIFDTLGYENYSNSGHLAHFLRNLDDLKPLPLPDTINTAAPVYLVLPKVKTDIEIRTIARIKKARLFFRAFDPEEQPRLSAADAIENVAQSHGVLTLLLPKDRIDAEVHNFRAAFVAGLALGLEKELLVLQYGDDPVPLDYQDLVKPFRFPNQIDEAVATFSPAISARFQSAAPALISEPQTLLERLNLGASAAENELQELGYYFLETDEFHRTLRGEIKIVAGRKGSGKTALFAQIRDNLREDRSNVVLDLKPAGFQLLKFKERVLDYLEEGTKEHTVTAFWEYLLLLEICQKVLAKDRALHMRDQRLYAPYRKLADTYYQDDLISEGDFAERMLKLKERIADDFGATLKNEEHKRILESGEITELLYKHDVARLRRDVMEYLRFKKSLWILFDNLDKGWPPHGIQAEDVLTLRCLLDAMVKVQRELGREDIECHGVVFIRNDVYELLVANTPDRGKVPSVILDWTDADLLRELLRRRFLYGDGLDGELPFETIWASIATSHVHGEESSQYLIDRCLMRPRALIELVRYCRSHAINLRHERIELGDIEHGEEAYSTDLLTTIDFEISDILPAGSNILYEFIEAPAKMSGSAVREILIKKLGDTGWNRVLDLLLWYGFLGFLRDDGETAYIYSVKYDIRRLRAIIDKKGFESSTLTINPAFWRALEVRN
ncbi:MAG: hypothetical protein AABN95_26155 [Acidobacteriota bacterium]